MKLVIDKHTHTHYHTFHYANMYAFLKHFSHILLALVIGLVINGPEKPSNIVKDFHVIMSDATHYAITKN